MAVNKVVINQDGVENVLIDITDSTVTPEKLAEGETAYDKSGEKITGTMPPGLDTSDATATAEDILMSKTAYVKGEKIKGSLPCTSANTITAYRADYVNWRSADYYDEGFPEIVMTTRMQKTWAFRQGAQLGVRADANKFGDATPEDVAKGKTFTSASGLKLVGTGSTTIDITDDGNGNLTIANAVVTYNNGDLHITT